MSSCIDQRCALHHILSLKQPKITHIFLVRSRIDNTDPCCRPMFSVASSIHIDCCPSPVLRVSSNTTQLCSCECESTTLLSIPACVCDECTNARQAELIRILRLVQHPGLPRSRFGIPLAFEYDLADLNFGHLRSIVYNPVVMGAVTKAKIALRDALREQWPPAWAADYPGIRLLDNATRITRFRQKLCDTTLAAAKCVIPLVTTACDSMLPLLQAQASDRQRDSEFTDLLRARGIPLNACANWLHVTNAVSLANYTAWYRKHRPHPPTP